MNDDTCIAWRSLRSPLGPLRLRADALGLVEVAFTDGDDASSPPPAASCARSTAFLDLAERELAAYFTGTLERFTVPLAARGTPFQRAVWRALEAIPFGQRLAYRDIARTLGRTGAERAVGAANGRNPIAIIVPCHRVVGANGALTGYAGGLDRKRWLLAHEARVAAVSFTLQSPARP